MRTFYYHGDLENKVKVKLSTCNKSSCNYIHLGCNYLVCTLNGYWYIDICPSHWFNGKNSTLPPQNPEKEDLRTLFWVCKVVFIWSVHRSDERAQWCQNYMPKHMKTQWFPFKKSVAAATLTEALSNWSGWCKRTSSPIDASTLMKNLPNPKMTVCATLKISKLDISHLCEIKFHYLNTHLRSPMPLPVRALHFELYF